MTVRPCWYPRCDDGTGNAELTDLGMCTSCRRRYSRLLEWLVLDYVTLRTTMPKPTSRGGEPVTGSRGEPGHPAEWASDTAARIADTLNAVEDELRYYAGDGQAPATWAGEAAKVRHAYRYLEPRVHLLAIFTLAERTARELVHLHGEIRGRLGQTRARQHVHAPCPECDLLTLYRSVNRAGTDEITCEACHCRIPAERYGLYARIVLDEVVEAASAPS